MRELLRSTRSELLPLDVYWPEFEENFRRTDASGFWKLERRQEFREPGQDSWEEFSRGNWREALELLERGRAALIAEHRKMTASGFSARRVRVVEEPITAYLQWELHALRVRDECGGPVRVLAADRVARLERAELLPELYTLGGEVMYEAVYDEHGVLEAARRYTDRAVIARCRQVIVDLYAAAQPIAAYFARHVAGLPAPEGQFTP
ncbi:DUF6879 family protein [Actinosynnema sp. NPDC020468]|uniref:DUF6879 family protein n=1 Tax=Actinosynnema sp. NPDC020468 TaxID=3154488 RepID=UPI0033C4B1D6